MSKPGEFDAAWDRYMQELKDIGMVEAGQKMTQLVKDRVTLWESNN